MPLSNDAVEDSIRAILIAEKTVNEQLDKLKTQYEHVFKALDALNAAKENVEEMKAELKDKLIQAEDFDLYKVDGVKVSVCPVVKLAVADESKVDEKYKSTEVVVDVKKAQEHKKLYGELPEGFLDKTYHRFTWKEETDAD